MRSATPWFLLFLVGWSCQGRSGPEDNEVFVSAAASLREVMIAVAESFETSHRSSVQLNFAGSGSLRQQIEMGSPADVFVSAAPEHIDRLVESGWVATTDRHVFARNVLVLVAANDSVRSLEDLEKDNVTRVAIGDPRSVPAGKYALEWLQAEGVWERIQGKTVLGGDVRQVLSYVERGEVDAGIVYATDAKLLGLEPVWIASGSTAPEAVYETALIDGRREPRPLARAFFDYLGSEEVVRELERAGFIAP